MSRLIVNTAVLLLFCTLLVSTAVAQPPDRQGQGPGTEFRSGQILTVPLDPSIKRTFVDFGRGPTALLYEPVAPGEKSHIAVVVMHSDLSYLTVPACTELAARGYRVLCAAKSSPPGASISLAIAELGQIVGYLRTVPGVQKVVLLGHSGGATLMSAYQMIAENGLKSCQGPEKIHKCPGTLAGLPASDGVMLVDSNWGNAEMALFSLDPSVIDNDDGMKLNPDLDLYNPKNGFNPNGNSDYSPEFIHKFQAAVAKREQAIIAKAMERLARIEAGQGRFLDDEPFFLAGAGQIVNRLFAQDTRLMSHTANAWPLLHADGSITNEIVWSVRKPRPMKPLTPVFALTGEMTTVRSFLTNHAIRVNDDFGFDEDTVHGIDWTSTYSSPPGNVESISSPLLVMGMTGSWEYLASETIYEHAKSADKSIAFVEGASHGYNTCKECETTPGQYGDTMKITYDYIDRWLSKNGRFLTSKTAIGPEAKRCEGMVSLMLPSINIISAQAIEAGALTLATPPGGSFGAGGRRPRTDLTKLPALCRIQATTRPSPENVAKFEVWMPLAGWNGSMLTVTHPSSANGNISPEIVDAITKGYSGLLNVGPAFDAWDLAAQSNDLLLDFGYRQHHAILVAAKIIQKIFYGEPVKRAFYSGCSEGGREGFNAAHHYPEDYDGIIVGGSGNQFAIINAAQLHPAWFIGKDPARFIPEKKWQMIHRTVLAACDGIDGVKDYVIEDPRLCDFKPESLLCKGAEADDCLTAPQIDALKAMYKGPINPRTDKVIFPGIAIGAELPAFEFANPNKAMTPAERLYKTLVLRDPNWDFRTMDFDRDVDSAVQKVGPALHTAPADLRDFIARGGKLIIWDGWNDFNPPYYWMDYFAEMQKLFGEKAVAEHVQMYFMPGVQHCGGGEGCDTWDKLGAITEWVSTGKPPARIHSAHLDDGIVTHTRPICPYPQVDRYRGSGDPSDEANFDCVAAKPGYK